MDAMDTTEQAQALTRDWTEKTRIEQILIRHQVWELSSLPNHEYTASFADVKELINERERLRDAASMLITNAELIDDPRRGGATDCYAVTLDDFDELQAALNDQKGDNGQ